MKEAKKQGTDKIFKYEMAGICILVMLEGMMLICHYINFMSCPSRVISAESRLYAGTRVCISSEYTYEDIKNGDIIVYDADRDNGKIFLADQVRDVTVEGLVLQGGAGVMEGRVTVPIENFKGKVMFQQKEKLDELEDKTNKYMIIGGIILVIILILVEFKGRLKNKKSDNS